MDLLHLLEIRRAVEERLQSLGYALQYGEMSLMREPYAEVGFARDGRDYVLQISVQERETEGETGEKTQ